MAHLVGLAGVDAFAHRHRPDVVFVLAVLPVEDLRRDRDGRVVVEHRDLERQHRQVALGERHHATRLDLHPLAAGRAPQDRPGHDAGAEVEVALVLDEVGDRQQQRLVVDVQADDLGVGCVDDRLTDLGEAERLLGVMDLPGLVEAVDERAVRERVAALVDVAAQAEIAVADREQRLRRAEVCGVDVVLDEPPLVDREARPVHELMLCRSDVDGLIRAPRGRRRRRPRRCSSSLSAPTPRLTPMTRPKSPAWPAATPDRASSSTTARSLGTSSWRAASRNVSGAGLPARKRSAATRPSTMTGK